MDIVLETKGIEKRIGSRRILKGIDLSLEEGKVLGIVGPNGAGKSSLMKILVGANYPTEGIVRVKNVDIHRDRVSAISYLAFLIEEPGFYPHLSGEAHLRLVTKDRGIKKVPSEALKFIDFSHKQLKKKVYTYSMGMKQRLALALCWAMEPSLMILDEPYNGLDPKGVRLLRESILEKSQQGVSFIISMHMLGELSAIADEVLFLGDGQVLWKGSKEDPTALEKRYHQFFGEDDE